MHSASHTSYSSESQVQLKTKPRLRSTAEDWYKKLTIPEISLQQICSSNSLFPLLSSAHSLSLLEFPASSTKRHPRCLATSRENSSPTSPLVVSNLNPAWRLEAPAGLRASLRSSAKSHAATPTMGYAPMLLRAAALWAGTAAPMGAAVEQATGATLAVSNLHFYSHVKCASQEINSLLLKAAEWLRQPWLLPN